LVGSGVVSVTHQVLCFHHISAAMQVWTYGLCIWSVVQAFGTIIAATMYLTLQYNYFYLATISLLILLNLLAHGFLGAEVKKQFRLAESDDDALKMNMREITEPAQSLDSFDDLNAAAARSHAAKGFLYRSEYQLFYTGPSLYTVVMFAIMLRDVTHGSSTILFKNFLPLFSLIQMQATAMSSLPTFVVALDTTGSHDDMKVALESLQEARIFHHSNTVRLAVPESFSKSAERFSVHTVGISTNTNVGYSGTTYAPIAASPENSPSRRRSSSVDRLTQLQIRPSRLEL